MLVGDLGPALKPADEVHALSVGQKLNSAGQSLKLKRLLARLHVVQEVSPQLQVGPVEVSRQRRVV
jgi:hypothetical protein